VLILGAAISTFFDVQEMFRIAGFLRIEMLYPTFSTPENCQSCLRLFILFLVFNSMQCSELGISDCVMPIVIATWSASSTLDNSCGHLPTSRNVIELVGKKTDGLSEDFWCQMINGFCPLNKWILINRPEGNMPIYFDQNRIFCFNAN